MEESKKLSSCVNKALFRLSSGDMTKAEMLLYLTDPRRKNTGFDAETAQKTVDRLAEEGFLDDVRYLKLLVKKMDGELFGPRKIKEVLTRHRFSPSHVEAVLKRDVDYSQRAFRLLLKKRGAEELAKTPAGRKKLLDFLLRRGYDYSAARFAVSQISDEEEAFSD